MSLIRAAAEGGYADHILLGMDLARRSYYTSYGGGPGIAYLLQRFIPRLRAEGLGDIVNGEAPGQSSRPLILCLFGRVGRWYTVPHPAVRAVTRRTRGRMPGTTCSVLARRLCAILVELSPDAVALVDGDVLVGLEACVTPNG